MATQNPVYVFSGKGYHGVVEDLAAILLLCDAGLTFDVVLDPSDKWMRGLVDLFVPMTIKRWFIERGRWVRPSSAVCVTKSAFGEFVNPANILRLRKAAGKVPAGDGPPNIFVSRADTDRRKFPKARRLEKEFIDKGFESVALGDLAVSAQVALFRSARRVAGEHGAGLVNVVWAEECEFLEEYYYTTHFNSCFSALATHLGVGYHCHDLDLMFD